MARKLWDTHWMEAAKLAAERATCRRRSVGAVLVKNNMQVSSGYNGSPRKAKHCTDEINNCLREELNIPSGQQHEKCRAIHAEQNAIIQCARTGASSEGTTLYCTTFPCSICAKMIINAGIVKVIYEGDYPDAEAKRLFKNAGITVRRFIFIK